MKKTPLYIATALILAGCGGSNDEQVAGVAAQATPVSVAEAVEYQHRPTQFFIGRMQAMESANLTPRTTGFLQKKLFDDGSLVEKGDVLFEIDPTSYQAALDAAKATLKEAEAALSLATLNHNRTQNMLNTGGVSQAQLDLSDAELTMARSRLESARANVLVQQDNLDQTQVRAPYSGKLGKSRFSIGDMVGPNFGPLIDLVQVDPIKASFSLKEGDLSQHDLSGENASIVTLEIDGQAETDQGVISFVDNKVSPASGTVSVAAEFLNSDGRYTPNQYVRVGLSPQSPLEGFKLPHAAIHQDSRSQYVFVIDQGIAKRVDVGVSDRIGQDVFVADDLEGHRSVIVGGLQRIREGSPVVAAE